MDMGVKEEITILKSDLTEPPEEGQVIKFRKGYTRYFTAEYVENMEHLERFDGEEYVFSIHDTRLPVISEYVDLEEIDPSEEERLAENIYTRYEDILTS